MIGGDEIVELFLPLATRLELTEVHEDTAGDVFMPRAGARMARGRARGARRRGRRPAYAFVSWERAGLMRLGHRDPVPEALRGAILALGNFDGFHLGPPGGGRARRSRWARAEGRPAIVATFDPHPVRHFAPHVPWFRLTSLDQREELFAAAGADAMLVFEFDDELAATTAEDFVGELLGGHLGAAGVVTGEDFTFGKGARRQCRAARRGGRAARDRRAHGRPGQRRRAAGLVEPHPRRAQGRRLRDRDAADDAAVRDSRGRAARRQARARRSAIRPPTSTSGTTCARATASMR